MSKVSKSRLPVAATAVTTAAALMLVTPPQAEAECAQYELPQELVLQQADGWSVQIPTSGSPRNIAGPSQAVYYKPGKTDPSNGTPVGGLTGNHINILVNWSNNSSIRFEGDIGPGGIASGTSKGQTNLFGSTWTAAGAMPCRTTATPPAADPANNAAPEAAPAPEEPAAPAPDPAAPAPAENEPCLPNPLGLNLPGLCPP